MQRASLSFTLVLAVFVVFGALSSATAADRESGPVRLAQNDRSNNLFSLYQTIQQLQQQVRVLQGQVDTLKYQIKQNDQSQRDLYQNLDNRLSALENNGASSRSGTTGVNTDIASGEPASAAGGDYGSSDYGGGGESAGDNVNSADAGRDVESAYMKGFNQLKNGDYSSAITSFKGFVAQYPKTNLSDNAWYWLGEAYYVQQQYDDANQAFETVVNQFGGSQKVPSSLYKIGLIQLAENQTDNATATLNRVRDQYPKTDAAEMAEQKLQSMGG